MVENVHCITLRVIKYNDTMSIATLWSKELGRISATLPSGKGREAQRRRAIMQPFSAFEAIARSKPGQEIVSLSDVKPMLAFGAPNPVKSVMAIFLADFLYMVLKENAPDRALSDYLFDAVADFQGIDGPKLANFHLMFLYRLGYFLGIQPDMGTWHPGYFFDSKDARFVKTPPMHSLWLGQQEAEMVRTLSRLTLRNIGVLKLARHQRNQILDGILNYYTLHYAPVSSLTSLAVVRDVFA